MPRSIDRHQLQRLLAEQEAQLVEVLPADEYADEHLPGAINIPLKDLDHETARRLDRARPVIGYCYDKQCDMSPRAAARLASIGFEQVYDYTAGKADWGSFGLPLEGDADSSTRVGSHLRAEVPTCRLEDRLPDLFQRLDENGWDTCFVVNNEGVLLGRIGRDAIRARQDVSAAEAMTAGPSTIRPSARLEDVAERMQRQSLTTLPVTTPDGRLVGLITRGDVEQARAAAER
jgi:rhodanese-related sulfurtransferase/CBS domain-containing protein